MDKHLKLVIGVLCCGVISTAPFTAFADTYEGAEAAVAAYSEHVEMISEPVPQSAYMTETEPEKTEVTRVLDRTEDGKAAEEAAQKEKEKEENGAAATAIAQAMVQAAETKAKENTDVRQNVVNYALSFLGGPYRYGGNDPRTGVDCSGFTRYVLGNAAGVQMLRSSGSQATQGIPVSADQMRPGDLLFYGGSGGINHVALYIGSGKIVHASTYETGIIISNWNYRNPVRIVSVLG